MDLKKLGSKPKPKGATAQVKPKEKSTTFSNFTTKQMIGIGLIFVGVLIIGIAIMTW